MPEFFPSDNRDLDLDFKDLETSVARQSSLFDYYASKEAEARETRDRAVNRLDTQSARTELDIRKNAAAGEKLTEAKIAAMVLADPELEKLRDEVVTANRALLDASRIVRALDHKKTAIECAVRMSVSRNYETTATGAVSDFKTEKTRDALRANLNKERT